MRPARRARYLIVKLAALGDVATASSLPGEIRRRDPEAHITWLAGSRVAELVRLFDVDETLVVDEVALMRGTAVARARALLSVWARLGRRRFDVTVLAHADRRYAAVVLPVRTGRLRAMHHGATDRSLPIPGRYFGDEYVRLLDAADSVGPIAGHYPLADVRGRLGAGAAPDGAVGVVLVPGGARNVLRESALRRWPAERYRDVAEGLIAQGLQVTLVGDAMDAWVRPLFAGLPVRDTMGACSLTETLAILREADLVITHDTGPLHLAQLVRAPTIALFGPTNPAQVVSPITGVEILWGGADLACRPCYNGRELADCAVNICIREITPEQVIAAALRHLGAGPAAG